MLKEKLSKVLAIGASCMTLVGMLGLCACGGAPAQTSSASSETTQDGYALVSDGTLTVATSPDYQPMEYQENGEIKGYDIALIKEVGNRLGLNVVIEEQPFDSLVSQVAAGTSFDCAISAIKISDERAGQVTFTNAYQDANLAIVTLATSEIAGKDALNGQPIGAQAGTSGERWVRENLPSAAYTPFQEVSDMLGALETGKIVAAIYDEPVAANHIATDYKECSILEVIPTGEQYGIIVNTGNAALADAINEAIAEMQADGTIAKLEEQWFGKAGE